jgi:hypothetical protein
VLRVRGEDGVREVPMLAPYLVELRPSDGIVVVDHLGDLDVLRPVRRGRAPRPAGPSRRGGAATGS